ncbi:50S ribosomal protein L11 methyltransferase, partial [Acinetobacter pittii]|uniref:50S ribosomal protein L11 methyltransferase n=1 Tax=Acinetobacter pittii TaxID=48296 RepID=UPI00227D03D9
MQDQLIDLLITGTIDTLLMVGASAFIAFLIGLPIAVILVSTSEHGIHPSQKINQALGWVINITRSVPFLILMVALIPLTRWIVGTSYGVVAIAAKMAGAKRVICCDIDQVSLNACRENALLNDVELEYLDDLYKAEQVDVLLAADVLYD